MTWVVGGPHLFCTRCIADIQVTLVYPSGKQEFLEGVKKIYYIDKGTFIAFAGSIKLAFGIVDFVKQKILNMREEMFMEPLEVAKKLQKEIKYWYDQLRQTNDEFVEFLLSIVPIGRYKEFGFYKLSSPLFKLIEPSSAFQLMQIGLGASVNDYKEIVKKHEQVGYIMDDPSNLDGKPTLVIPTGKVALQLLYAEAVEYQNAGISQSMHIARLSHQQFYIDELPFDLKAGFPKVANSWKELEKLIKAKGKRLADCHAYA